ncbi:UNVERIFIED_CONTAM: putative pentatricopeptide repeat-containing protein [Sesamum calycinum]|uniref:Pentatricopeptide repeat-containing protein n=1 Tax=Sesamum calycinum TaxID=2727403 RepID=A0AAW2P5Z0_9LAMI
MEFFALMKDRGIAATAESIAVVISVCDEMPSKGEIVHGHVITAGFEKYIFVRNALISMYGENGAVEKAEYLFSGLKSQSVVSWNSLISAYAQSGLCDEAFSAFMRLESSHNNLTVSPNVVSWTAVINGFAASGRHKETLDLFRRMQFARVPANAVTVAGVLSVSAELSALPLGRELHAHAIRVLMDSDMLVTNGLINMYMKCGSLRTGHSIFERMVYRDITSWNIIITGYGIHGLGDRALKIFHQMVNAGVKPDEVTFVAVLSACSHSGLITEGHQLFHQMTQDFQIEPQVEHYACLVDLFGRAGLLQEASNVLKSMPMEPNAQLYVALKFICSKRRWDDSAKVRISAKTRGLRKIPGQSWIEVKKKFHSFSAGKALTSEMEELHGVLKELNLQMVMESHSSNGFFEPC